MNMKYVMLCLLIATQPPFPTDTMQLLVIKNPLICPAEKKTVSAQFQIRKQTQKQEYISVGCIPTTTVAFTRFHHWGLQETPPVGRPPYPVGRT